MTVGVLRDLRLMIAAALAATIFTLHYSGLIGGADALLYALIIILIADAGHRRLQDASRRRSAQAALEASEVRFRTIFETLSVAIWEHDFTEVKRELDRLRDAGVVDLRRHIFQHPDFVGRMRRLVRITDANQTALRLMEIDTKEEFFKSLSQILPAADKSFADCLIAINEGHPRFETEAIVRSRSGRLINVLVGLSFPAHGQGLDRIQGCIVDITERVDIQKTLDRAQAELERKSRAAILGDISGSIAHEVNQPLSAIMTSAQAARRWLTRLPPDLDEIDAALKDVIYASELAAQVVRRVRMLLGNAETEREPVCIESVIRDAARLKRRALIDNGVQLTLNLTDEKPVILADRILLQQALINIITNSIQALDEMPIESRALSIASEIEHGEIVVRVTDTGPGVATDMEQQLFKPFSTTKADGMGLGLATCRSIVTAHDGHISIANNDRVTGAEVTMSFPLHRSKLLQGLPETAAE